MSKAGSRNQNVKFANADANLVDKKFEGYSNLKAKHD